MPVATSAIGPATLASDAAPDPSDVVISDDAALTPSMGPVGNASDAAALPDTSGQISIYTVQPGDTVASVAAMFGVGRGEEGRIDGGFFLQITR